MKKIHPDKYEALRTELKALNTKHRALLALFDKQNAAYAALEKEVQAHEAPPL